MGNNWMLPLKGPLMAEKAKILIVGETWITNSVHTKGFDSFSTSSFGEGYSYLKSALERGGFHVDVIENHVASTAFPDSVAGLAQYSTIILSDIGANTLLLTPTTWRLAQPAPNKLQVIADYVKAGGGLIMIGGYLTFTGIEAKGCWKDTVVEACLPVRLMATDDRREHPEGVSGEVVDAAHPVLSGIDGAWPKLLGYNRVTLAPDGRLVAKIGNDPLLALGEAGAGRTAAFMSDCSPHWCPQDFMAWPGYGTLWRNICAWTSRL
jgi:uncharacterized membrane protein